MDMLKIENIRLKDKVSDWKEAVHLSVHPLIEGKYVEEGYVDDIFEVTEKYGPYYVLVEHVALVHAGNRCVNQSQLAITVLKEAVKFSETSYPVRLLVALAAKDSQEHVSALAKLADVLNDPELIEMIIESDDIQYIYDQFIKEREG